MTKILIVTENAQTSRELNFALSYYGFVVEVAVTRPQALKALDEIYFGLILMDFDFNKKEDFPFYKELRINGNQCPVVVMGEQSEEGAIIEGMYKGFDDYILRPYNVSELRMVINRLLERRGLMIRPLVFGDISIDASRSIVMVKDKIISLGRKEMEILISLTRKAGRIVLTNNLMTRARMDLLKWKLKQAGVALQIKNYGIGYKLVDPSGQ